MDFKSVYMPTLRQLLLNDYKPIISISKNGQNNPGDVDEEFIALPRFLRLACENRPHAIEMLHAEGDSLLETSPIWEHIRAQRTSFYSKNIDNLVAFANDQAERYVNRARSYRALTEIMEVLRRHPIKTRLYKLQAELPINEMAKYEDRENAKYPCYIIGDKQFENSLMIKDVTPSVEKMLRVYGERVKRINENEVVVDWDAVGHALRSAYQAIAILQNGDFSYPLPQTDYLRKVKVGQIEYSEIQQELSRVTDLVKHLKAQSSLPEEVNFESWEDRLIGYYLNSFPELREVECK